MDQSPGCPGPCGERSRDSVASGPLPPRPRLQAHTRSLVPLCLCHGPHIHHSSHRAPLTSLGLWEPAPQTGFKLPTAGSVSRAGLDPRPHLGASSPGMSEQEGVWAGPRMPPLPAEAELDLPGRGQPTGPWSRQKQHWEPHVLEKAGNTGWLQGSWRPWKAGPLGIGLGTHQRDTWSAVSTGEAGHLPRAARANGTGSPSYQMGAHGGIKALSHLKALPVAEERGEEGREE
uniref:Uncharacterized protein LOC112815604 n=1 Tax=Callorhinus ursinus TaxID=34884 RepID=A0A3Q7N7B0_CALUR|nr:uncharacterized protein LOC112815604 [Callorhinus ursinus]